MKALSQSPHLPVLATLALIALVAAAWSVRPVHAESSSVTAAPACNSQNVVDKDPHHGIDIKLLVHRPDRLPTVIRLDV